MKKTDYAKLRKSVNLEKSLYPLFKYFFIDAIIIATLVYRVSREKMYMGIPFLVVLMFRNFSLMHDAVHGAISNRKILNIIIGYWTSLLCFLPFNGWKESHLLHHLWSGNLEKDPVMALRITLPRQSALSQKVLTLAWKSWIPVLALLQYTLFWKLALHHALKTHSVKKKIEMFVPILFWGLLVVSAPQGFFMKLFAPAMFLYLLAEEIVNFPHHLQLPMTSGDEKYPVWLQYISSRTCVYPKWFARHFVLNFNYHTEHHMFPDAPWYRLEDIHIALRGELLDQQNIDLNIDWIIKNRKLTLAEVVVPKSATYRKSA